MVDKKRARWILIMINNQIAISFIKENKVHWNTETLKHWNTHGLICIFSPKVHHFPVYVEKMSSFKYVTNLNIKWSIRSNHHHLTSSTTGKIKHIMTQKPHRFGYDLNFSKKRKRNKLCQIIIQSIWLVLIQIVSDGTFVCCKCPNLDVKRKREEIANL